MIIYCITNKINGKPYIGQTIRTLEERIADHKHCKKTLIGKAIQKYGWSDKTFKVEILEVCETLEQLNEREKFWIAKYNSIVPNGYNMTEGGSIGIPGKPKSEATRARMKLAQAKNRKCVCCIETGEVFESIKMAAEHYGIGSGEISSACHGKRNTAAGLHWLFLEDWLSADDKTRADLLAKLPHRRKRVRCIETDEIFTSTRKAAEKYGTDHKNISRACRKPTRIALGMHWTFVD